jgi:hypothetical protein
MSKTVSPARQLEGFIVKHPPEIGRLARVAVAKMRKRLPGATVLVYDNYNALAVGFGPGERTSDAIFSIAVYPKWVNLYFLKGAGLPDPHKLLKGKGKVGRYIRLASAADLYTPPVRELISAALARAEPTIDPAARGDVIIKSISAKQRPRRPA